MSTQPTAEPDLAETLAGLFRAPAAGESPALHACRSCGASVQQHDREVHAAWHVQLIRRVRAAARTEPWAGAP